MSIAIATTRITVERPATPSTEDPYGDGYDAPADRDDSTSNIVTDHRATISPSVTSSGSSAGGESQVGIFRLTCDPCGMSYSDTVIDERTGQRYEVQWAIETPGVAGLGHVAAELRVIEGRSL